MSREELAFLADHVTTIDGRRPDRLAEVQGRIRAARRRRAAGAVGGTALLTAAVIAAFAVVPRSGEDSHGPVGEPTLPTVSPIEEPAGQTTISADFGPQAVVSGNVEIGSALSDPGATEVHANLPYYTPYAVISGYCRGSEDVWWAGNGTYGQCSPDDPLVPTPPEEFQPIGNAGRPLPEAPGDQELSVDLFLTGPLPVTARRCLVGSPDTDTSYECLTSDPDVVLLRHADATFGFTAYVHSAPTAIHGPFGMGFEALADVGGTDFLFTNGVVSAPGADRLATYLDVSEQPRLVLVVMRGPGGQRAALRIDGEKPGFPDDLPPGSAWEWGRAEIAFRALVPPGSHNVTVDVPQGGQAAVLIYEAESQP